MSNINKKYQPFVSALVTSFVPEHIVEQYPGLMTFIYGFLDYLEVENKSGYIQNTLQYQRDLDIQESQFRLLIEKELGIDISQKYAADPTIFYQKIVDLWRAKGTEEAILTFLQILLDTDDTKPTILYPFDYVFKPSDGNWNQEKFITVRRVVGTVPTDVEFVRIFFESLTYDVPVTRWEQISTSRFRFYFRVSDFFQAQIGASVQIIELDDTPIFISNIIPSPNRIDIVEPGADWQKGQIITIPGTNSDTLARIAEINLDGAAQRIEIIQFGGDHEEDQSIITSPYPNRPPSANFNIEETIISSDPLIIEYTLTIVDLIDNISDSVIGSQIGSGIDAYFLEEYVETSGSYVGNEVINIATISTLDTTGDQTVSGVDTQRYYDSRTRIIYKFAPVSNLLGTWSNENGQSSNQIIRLQDSEYYQQFSYEINSVYAREVYSSAIEKMHPSGMKRFDNLLLSTNLTVDSLIESFISILSSFFFDVVETSDDIGIILQKIFTDAVESSDDVYMNFSKEFNDSVESSDNIQQMSLTKYFIDSITVSENIVAFGVPKEFIDTAETSDEFSLEYIKIFEETLESIDSNVVQLDKYIQDSLVIDDSGTASLTDSSYTEEGYFLEDYNQAGFILTIGES